MLTLPTNFKNDIQGRDTALVPVVQIGDTNVGSFYISTNSMALEAPSSFTYDTTISKWVPTFFDVTTKPLLLNIPSLKESIDIEKRNYRINSLSIDISNYAYEGKRFSEIFADTSLINTECRIYWLSPSVKYLIKLDESYSNDMDAENYAFQVYFGTIRRYTHDDEKVKLVVEDRSQSILHKDLPLPENYLTGDEVPDKYKGKPIPMVYGHVDKSPCVFKSRDEILIDTETVTEISTSDDFGYTDDTLWAYVDDNYVNVVKANQYTYDDNKIMLNISNVDMFGIPETGESIDEGFLLCRDKSSNFTITLSNTRDNPNGVTEDYDIPSGSLMKTIDGIDAANAVAWKGERSYGIADVGDIISSSRTNNLVVLYDSNAGNLAIDFRTIYSINFAELNTGARELFLLKLGFNFIPNYDHVGFPALIGLNINGYAMTDNLPYYHSGTFEDKASVFQTHQNEGDDPDGVSGLSQHYDDYVLFTNHPDYDGTSSDTLYHWFNFKDVDAATGDTNSNAAFQISISATESDNILTASLDLDGSNVREIGLLREVQVAKFFKYKYYANTVGRETVIIPGGGVGGGPISPTTYRSPSVPTVIKHILENELGVTGIDTVEIYYDDWEYAFTVDKKINSKKLIEGIASASPYIPRFDNMGNFKFSVIPMDDEGVTTNPDESESPNHHLKEADVIDFSFSRTKVEDVYTKVVFKYNWDYAREEFNDIVEADILDILATNTDTTLNYDPNYYGLESDHSESTLVIDDDRGKYIRDHDTAEDFADWLLLWSCNQHLKMKIKLPLKYMNLEIGDFVDFDDILGGVKPYGIDYRTTGTVNMQEVFKNFLITSTNKTLEFCEIECIQMHNLDV